MNGQSPPPPKKKKILADEERATTTGMEAFSCDPGRGSVGTLTEMWHGMFLTLGPEPLSSNVVQQLDKTYSRCGSRQTLTLPSDCVLCLMRMEVVAFSSRARILGECSTIHSPPALFL